MTAKNSTKESSWISFQHKGKTYRYHPQKTFVGKGGIKHVYKCYQGKVPFALDVYQPDKPLTIDKWKRRQHKINQSIDVLKQLDLYHGLVEKGQTTYLLRKWVHGKPLESFKPKRSKFSLRSLIEQMLLSLLPFHQRDLVHGDIKPKNMIVYDKKVYLIDFDTCLPLGLNTRVSPQTLIRTSDYRPPELDRLKSVSKSTDIYSMGASIQEIISDDKEGKIFKERLFSINKILDRFVRPALKLMSFDMQNKNEKQRPSLQKTLNQLYKIQLDAYSYGLGLGYFGGLAFCLALISFELIATSALILSLQLMSISFCFLYTALDYYSKTSAINECFDGSTTKPSLTTSNRTQDSANPAWMPKASKGYYHRFYQRRQSYPIGEEQLANADSIPRPRRGSL